ncbi:MAG TPA: hypothetical protein PL113_00010 [Bacteroidia bacterium]|nr:hypothetical protein [Bacteroidia bacterium]
MKNIREFRTWFKNLQKSRQNEYCNEHFMGAFHEDITGFLGMYHGDKEDIYGFLRKEVEMAEDGQAIYEFVQNAADSNSSHFYLFYNEQYLLAINNGIPFSKEGVKSILNIGQSYGKTEPDKIGRFGIGFKLVHRLVGKTQGLDELLNTDGNGFRGPIIFSWFNNSQFNEFISSKSFEYCDIDSNACWLFKIVATNFPALPNEEVLDFNYENYIPFPESELLEFQEYLNKEISHIDNKILETGTAVFIKLGEGKFDYLMEQQREYSQGLTTSMHFLKFIKNITINNQTITKDKNANNVKEFVIKNGSPDFNSIGLTEERDKKCDIKFTICYADSIDKGLNIKAQPNIYKYFPAVKEVNNLSFIIHSNVFELSSNRQNLTASAINKSLLKLLVKYIIEFLETEKNNNLTNYLNIFGSILLSDKPNTLSGNGWQQEYFYDILNQYAENNLPTSENNFVNSQKAAIKTTKLNVLPKTFGVGREWLIWKSDKYSELKKIIHSKFDVPQLNLSKLIVNGNIDKINEWILNADEKDYALFINELEKDIPDENFFDLQFLKCTDGNYYSINEIASSANVLCLFEKIQGVKDILNELELLTTEINISDFKNIADEASKKIPYLKTINEKKVFDDFIKNATTENGLSPENKKRLFVAIKELYNVGEKSLKEWELFSNKENEIHPLSKLISPTIKVEKWLAKYQLLKSEYFEELEEYLLQADEIYPSIIYPLWDELIEVNEFDDLTIGEFYSSVKNYFDEEAHKSLVLNKKAYIFTNEGFYPTSEVFYNEYFNSIMDYPALKSSIEKITGFKTPSKKVLKYLTESPFKTDNDKLLDHLSDCSLEQSEAYELLRYCQKAEVKLFSKGVFCESDNDIKWECNDSKIQYFSEDTRLIEFINEYLEDTFYLLPAALQDFKSFEGVKRNQELYEEIIEQLENINDLAVEFLPLLNHKEVIKSYLSNLSEIRIENKSLFDKSSFEYILVSNIISHFEDEELEELKEKIIICDDDTELKLEEIVTGNEVRFDIDNKIYNIKISEILPDSDNFAKAELLETIIANFKRLELPKTKIDKLLSIEIEEDDLAEKLADELIDYIKDYTLETAEQIAFCLLYELQSGWSKFDEFQIFASNNETYKLNEVWYVKPFSFLSNTGAIGEQYKGLSKLLKIKDENPIFKVSDSCIFLYKPAFDEDGNFICNYIDENLNEEKCIDLLNFLFEEYNKRGRESRRDFEEIDDWSKLGDTETEKILGFNPHNTIIIEDDEFLLTDEVAPDWLQVWAKDEANISFLKVLGIHFEDSDIVKLRKSLYDDDESITKDEIKGSNALNANLLENTLKWLVESEIWEDKVIDEPIKVELLDAIIEKLGWDLKDYWSVDIEKLNEYSEEWDDEGYSNWREEYDSFEIRIFQNEMPYILQYDEQIIAEKFENDFWYDEDNETLYINGNKSSIELLIQNAADDNLFETDIKLLINKGLAKVNELERKVKELERENNELKSTPDRTPKKTDRISKEDQEKANLDARIAVKKYLKVCEGYDVSEWDPYNSLAAVRGKIKKNGEYIDIVVKSAKWGDIFLAANEFELLCQDAKNQLFVYNGYDVKPVTLKSIFEANSLIQLQIDTIHINGKFLGMLAKAFQYVANTKFVVEDPNHSAHNLLNRLGMNNLNEGFISAAANDEW